MWKAIRCGRAWWNEPKILSGPARGRIWVRQRTDRCWIGTGGRLDGRVGVAPLSCRFDVAGRRVEGDPCGDLQRPAVGIEGICRGIGEAVREEIGGSRGREAEAGCRKRKRSTGIMVQRLTGREGRDVLVRPRFPSPVSPPVSPAPGRLCQAAELPSPTTATSWYSNPNKNVETG
jgi:hypothetical protein